jgi:hypothetical protein
MSANNPERADKTECVRKISRFEVIISPERQSTTRTKRHCSIVKYITVNALLTMRI